MRIPPGLQHLWPFTIRAYAIGFIVFTALVFGILGWAVQDKLDTISTAAKIRNTNAANEEFAYVISRIISEIRHRADSLVMQDEARQQLVDPVYYGYWRDNRVRAAGVLPGYVQAIEMYTRQGASLAAHPINDMPTHINPLDIGSFLTRQGNHYYLTIFYPIPASDGRPGSTLGYLGFKLDFLNAVKKEQRFSYVNPNSIHIKVDEQEHLPLSQLTSRLGFTLRPNPESTALASTVKQFQQQVLPVMIGLSLLFYLMLASLLAAPLRRLSLHIDALREGRGGLLAESFTRSLPVAELEKVRHSLNDYQSKLEQMHRSLNQKNDELRTLAHHDPLTGIYNRRGFEEDWERVLSVSSGHRLEVSLILFDCDHFKAINDTYGHQVGDQVIQGLAESLYGALRTGERLYRLGGDEFATVLFSASLERARQVAERCIEQVLRHDFPAYGVKEPVRVSVGIAYLEEAGDDALKLLHRQADMAMYHAKRPGQCKIAIFSPDMGEGQSALVSNAGISAVYEAMAAPDRLEMHYQPVLALPGSYIEYYEALVRIRGEHGLIMPASIFPVVELRGLEAEFDLAVLERVKSDLEAGRIPAGAGVSLNVSGPGIVNARVIDKLMQYVPLLSAYKLVLEVTETALITQIAQASSNLNRLRKEGFVIALDDFGSGYSSLRYLSSMPVDLVKFDISMVRSLEETGRQAVLVEDLARMIKDAGYSLVAEGIETEALLQRVTALGFSHAQGFHIGRPAALMTVASVSRVAG